MTRQTSIEAYETIKANGMLSDARMRVYDHLFHNGPLTAGELAKAIDWRHVGAVNARLGELRDMGVAIENQERVCSISGMTVIEWDVTDRLPDTFKKKVGWQKAGEYESWAEMSNHVPMTGFEVKIITKEAPRRWCMYVRVLP